MCQLFNLCIYYCDLKKIIISAQLIFGAKFVRQEVPFSSIISYTTHPRFLALRETNMHRAIATNTNSCSITKTQMNLTQVRQVLFLQYLLATIESNIFYYLRCYKMQSKLVVQYSIQFLYQSQFSNLDTHCQ